MIISDWTYYIKHNYKLDKTYFRTCTINFFIEGKTFSNNNQRSKSCRYSFVCFLESKYQHPIPPNMGSLSCYLDGGLRTMLGFCGTTQPSCDHFGKKGIGVCFQISPSAFFFFNEIVQFTASWSAIHNSFCNTQRYMII